MFDIRLVQELLMLPSDTLAGTIMLSLWAPDGDTSEDPYECLPLAVIEGNRGQEGYDLKVNLSLRKTLSGSANFSVVTSNSNGQCRRERSGVQSEIEQCFWNSPANYVRRGRRGRAFRRWVHAAPATLLDLGFLHSVIQCSTDNMTPLGIGKSVIHTNWNCHFLVLEDPFWDKKLLYKVIVMLSGVTLPGEPCIKIAMSPLLSQFFLNWLLKMKIIWI